MNTPEDQKGRGFKFSFIIHTIVGSLALAAMIASFAVETAHPGLHGQIAWGFLSTVIVCYFMASLHYAKYLSLQR